jgi:predicted acetyltransferase
VLSHALVKPHILKTPAAIYKIGAIGSVVTQSEYRNKGLSKRILEDCLEVCKAQQCDIAILWTNLYDFYQKLGFTLAGYEINLQIDENFKVPQNSHLRVLKSTQVDPHALLKLMNQHSVMTVRTPEDIRKLMNIPSSNIYTAWDSQSQIYAYAVEGKGADLSGYVHEWGGSVSELCEVFKHIQTEKKTPIHVIAPKHSVNLINTLEQAGARKNVGFLGMIKIIDQDSLFKKIHKYAKLSLGINNLVLEKMNNEYRIGTIQQYLTTQQISDLALLIFGPHKFADLKGMNQASVETLSKIFPLPLWLWGWDSI